MVDIYRDAKRRVIYSLVFTDPEDGMDKKMLLQFLLLKLLENDAPFFSPFAKQ